MLYKKSKKQKIVDFAKSNPSMSRKEMAKACGVKLKYVYSILSEAGLTDKTHWGAKKAKTTKRKQVVRNSRMKISFMFNERVFSMTLGEAREVYNELKSLMEK
jgi:DeoR/GlpR family transcriptional regulator of sugar metabolism|tara:strand:+ start:509 stop:817 length:309 start_codon:yes stop_codon:yes gene_type:complete